MYVSPNHPKYAELTGKSSDLQTASEPPRETGEKMAVFPRSNRQGGEEELRVTLDQYEGHAFISVRLWVQDRQSGAWWPSKKGVSVRLSEAAGVSEALLTALRINDKRNNGASPRPGPSRSNPKKSGRVEAGAKGEMGQVSPQSGGEFCEFDPAG